MAIKEGDNIKIEYEGKLEDGRVFDSSKKGENPQPLEFQIGARQVIPGFENEIKGMEKGQKKEFIISPEKGYGERREELKKEFPRSALPPSPEGQEPKAGMILMVQSPQGQQFPAQIVDVKDETIILDLNHPLAGKKLIFNVEVIDVQSKREGQTNTKKKSGDEENANSSQ